MEQSVNMEGAGQYECLLYAAMKRDLFYNQCPHY